MKNKMKTKHFYSPEKVKQDDKIPIPELKREIGVCKQNLLPRPRIIFTEFVEPQRVPNEPQ